MFPQSDSVASVVTHNLTVNDDLSWMAIVHGHQVNSTMCVPLSDVPNRLNSESLKVLVAKLDSCRVCPGHPDKNFVEMVMSKKGKLTSINGKQVVATIDSAAPVQLNGDLYIQTVRYKSCQILTNDTKCAQCVQYRDTLRKSFHRWKINTSPHRNTASTSHTNLGYLNTPEKQQRYRKLKIRSDTAERKVKRMMEKLTEKMEFNWRKVCIMTYSP